MVERINTIGSQYPRNHASRRDATISVPIHPLNQLEMFPVGQRVQFLHLDVIMRTTATLDEDVERKIQRRLPPKITLNPLEKFPRMAMNLG